MSFTNIAAALLLAAGPAPSPASEGCACARAVLVNGWCGACDVGYVASVEVRSRLLHEALDAHGHAIPRAGLECERCVGNFDEGGFCDDCRVGFVDEMAYFSRLTYHLAAGKVVDASTITCETCAQAAAQRTLPLKEAWCGTCGTGMVGNVAFTDRKRYRAARREYERLLRAVAVSETCRRCGLAAFFDDRCRLHGIAYRDGEPVQPDAAGDGDGGAGEPPDGDG